MRQQTFDRFRKTWDDAMANPLLLAVLGTGHQVVVMDEGVCNMYSVERFVEWRASRAKLNENAGVPAGQTVNQLAKLP
jgi:hypothetical protein